MAEDTDTGITSAAQDDAVASSVHEEDLGEDLRRFAPVVIAFLGAVALVELVRWGIRRLERRLIRRHPLLTELAEELVDPDWRHLHQPYLE